MEIYKNNAFFDKLKQNVTDSFGQLRKAVDMREKLLLRQLTVVVQQAQHITYEFDSIRFLGDGEDDLVGRIRAYGRYNIDNFNIMLQKEPYENEDYILPSNDHDLMHKSCRQGADDERDPESEEIVVEFFNNRSLIREGAEMVRESIINLTLSESRELIDRTIGAKPTTMAIDREGSPELSEVAAMRTCKIDPTTYRLHRGHRSSLPGMALSEAPMHSLSFQGELRGIGKAAFDHDDDPVGDGCNNNHNLSCVGNATPGSQAKPRNTSRDGEKMISLSLPTPHRMIPKASQTDVLVISSTDAEGNVRETPYKAATDKRVKHVGHLTMNSCGSTINLKNVTNLTINACPERLPTPTKVKQRERQTVPDGAENSVPSEEGSPECGFYKRLITENKILRNHIMKTKLSTIRPYSAQSEPEAISSSPSEHATLSTSSDNTVTDDRPTDREGTEGAHTSAPSSLPATKGDANLNIPFSEQELRQMLDMPSTLYDRQSLSFVLGELYGLSSGDAVGSGLLNVVSDTKEHTMQIQQWLKQIISEAETEPFQNAEMLEFSKIHN
ncbi:uncharacterized protein LOC128267379 [Anopheles cruzii]|uniref:uncharacterized protein LOC128267379 n=1 Tax=Anopheles cruzii TaxID=68878 RepID=UPI0022EC90EC|nr:uncharacterized protein LOC128267379 [Anopheles cruzii]